ncbi:hypothetical protein pEp_SNUABM10_00040 [Erwinia phage pEp_SNUABM_10]|uniref:Uncharacterized protein n=1 Tax=Erwinia phage pEp_SNUABM_09 TaxID=2601644 RepID=A0A5J6DB67_9CAUD|nr:hypothetical protein pEpSNUABM09_38 [Erwinia phage pEp_SNUABM_09]QOC57639.1 hypothetical protein pEp_SNUABM03_00037 [Erwinia phage pEp_SNUABM_03]QOC57694.1 hypothetical protein pEp_SNUABM04_00040 [Erwinia phage pEp_SNUABM_04]QOC57744.1 hypothetical protein pEp_SNUABM10_00040 [Erwinia phage pEp_SNUABM_10]QOC57796.1 hypothetical protein pEp_SNUABM11_00040 [Erwinia phage pEp_SNUABM_11]
MQEVNWCIRKLRDALADYNMEDAKNYLSLLELWKDKLNGTA